jgi:hypothetical protein
MMIFQFANCKGLPEATVNPLITIKTDLYSHFIPFPMNNSDSKISRHQKSSRRVSPGAARRLAQDLTISPVPRGWFCGTSSSSHFIWLEVFHHHVAMSQNVKSLAS